MTYNEVTKMIIIQQFNNMEYVYDLMIGVKSKIQST